MIFLKAIILAAGRGSRMKEKTEILPKCLTELFGKTLLEMQIKSLQNSGVEEIGIVTGYKAEEITKRFPTLKYFHNDAWLETNMVSSLLKANEWLESDSCIVSYSDIVYTSKAVEILKNVSAEISITYYTKFLKLWEQRFENPLEDLETFKIDDNLNLIEIGQKTKHLEDIQGQYMGLLKFSPNGWEKIKNTMKKNLPRPIEKMDMTSLLNHALSNDVKIKTIPYEDLWLEVDNQKDLQLYESWKKEKFQELFS